MIFGKKKEQEQREKIILYKRVFGSKEGKEVLFDILNKNFILATHQGDPFMEGRRAAALDLLTLCNINLNEFDKLMNEGVTE